MHIDATTTALLAFAFAVAAPIPNDQQPHSCQAVLLTNSDLPAAQAETAFRVYLEAVEPVQSTSDFPGVVDGLSSRLSEALGGYWDIYTAGEGMLSYSVPCAKYAELMGDAWVAVLCQTVDDDALLRDSPMLCSQFHSLGGGTLALERYARLLRDRGDGDVSQHDSFAAVELSEMRPEDEYTFPNVAKARLVRSE